METNLPWKGTDGENQRERRVVVCGGERADIYVCLCWLHCTEIPIYVFPEMRLLGLVPNSYIHVSLGIYIFPGSLIDT
jgi:hypothetical protein